MDRYGVLARRAATTAWVDLYTCPETEETTYESGTISVRPLVAGSNVSALVSSITLCRLAGAAGGEAWVSLAVVDAPGTAPTNNDYVLYEQDVSGGETKVIGIGMTLSSGQTIRLIGESNDSVCVMLNGSEIL